VSGEELSQIELSEITRPAAAALNRESGYFFETIDDRLVFGFLTEWDQQAGASRGGEFFFNIFTMDKQHIQNINLHELKQQLESVAVRSPKKPPSDHSTISLKEVNDPNYNKINDIISQWQKYGKAKANLSEVSSLISGIPESIEYIKYVSKINNDSGGDHYNIYKEGQSTEIRTKRSITDEKSYLSEIKKQSEKLDRNRKMLQYLIYITLLNLIFLLILSSIVYYLYFF
jgi:hypothetical protein